jgi:ABC-type multidrug transport system ATPase subunit
LQKQVELTTLRDVLVGTDETYGLSFEQKKRLSIAVELAASPSVLFLDEVRSGLSYDDSPLVALLTHLVFLVQPTSGLDARSAHLVARTLRSISDSGRTVVATIHQPSSAVFGMFVRVTGNQNQITFLP